MRNNLAGLSVIDTLTKNEFLANTFYDCQDEVVRENSAISRAEIVYKNR